MKEEIVILDLFSGMGGFSKGFADAGFKIKKHYYSEIDKHAIAVYKYNFKNSIYAGSVDTIQSGDIERPDVITFGSPCQDFSLAGKRAGMGGERSSLILHAIRLIAELRPRFFIWENVKGAFSSNNSEDFWAILQAFANIGGYRLEWQLLNTVWFLPQNRERIYLVGHLAEAGRGWSRVFPIGEKNEIYNESGANKKKIYSDTPALTLCANDEKSWNGNYLKVKSATSSDFEIATLGDSVNLSNPNSKTRRGRVGKGVANTLDCGCNQAVIGAIRGRNPENPRSRESGLKTEQMLEINQNDCANTLTSVQKDNVVVTYPLIRRLTEIECERLQGFPDDWSKYGDYDGVIKLVPRTQRYKMCGNAVTVRVVQEVASRLKF